jgi:hypothetical protein
MEADLTKAHTPILRSSKEPPTSTDQKETHQFTLKLQITTMDGTQIPVLRRREMSSTKLRNKIVSPIKI